MTAPVPTVDLRPDHWDTVRSALRRHVPDREVLAFGSRATWTAKDYSDLDLAIMGEEPLPLHTAAALSEALGDSDLPFRVDVVEWARIDAGFRKIIRRHGVSMQAPSRNAKATRPVGESSTSSPESTEQPSQLGICAKIVMGQSPPGSTTNTTGDGVPLLNGPTEFGPHHPAPSQFTTDPRKMAYPGDLLFCVRGSTTGRMNWADQEYAIGRGVAALRHKRGNQFQPFVRGVVEFSLPELLSQATGSTFPNVSARQLATVWWPPLKLSEQRAIAHILGTLDDKIDLNRRMNATLEAMARALFKSWFVDFDPVRAKMEGRDTGLPLGIADLFPDKLVGSEMGEIPEGWKVGRVSDICMRIENGGTPKRAIREYWNGDIKWFKTSELVDEPLLESSERITDLGLRKSSCKRWPAGTVLIALYASPTVGRLGILEVPAAANQACCGLVSAPDYGKLFLYYTLLFGRPFFQNIAVGAAQQNISQRIVRDYKIVIPRRDISSAFDNMAEVLYLQRVSRQSESRVLSAIRDTLLPKLVSGEVRVPDAERAMESIT